MIILIAAKAKNNVIGRGNDLPWHIPADLKHFKKTTKGQTVLMGRMTWESLPIKPLPGRRNIVISSKDLAVNNLERVHSVDEAFGIVGPDEDVYVIGGEQLYRSVIPIADRLIISELDLEIEGDRFFPEIDPVLWAVETEEHVTDGDNPFKIVTYVPIREQ